MEIKKAERKDLGPCVDILYSSELGRRYYPNRELLREAMETGLAQDEVYVNIPGGGVLQTLRSLV